MYPPIPQTDGQTLKPILESAGETSPCVAAETWGSRFQRHGFFKPYTASQHTGLELALFLTQCALED